MKLRCVISFALGAAAAASVGLGAAIADRIPSDLPISGINSISDFESLSEITKFVDPDKLDELASKWISYRGGASSESTCDYLREGAANLCSRAAELYGRATDVLREKYCKLKEETVNEYSPTSSEVTEAPQESTPSDMSEQFDSEEPCCTCNCEICCFGNDSETPENRNDIPLSDNGNKCRDSQKSIIKNNSSIKNKSNEER